MKNSLFSILLFILLLGFLTYTDLSFVVMLLKCVMKWKRA